MDIRLRAQGITYIWIHLKKIGHLIRSGSQNWFIQPYCIVLVG